MADERYIEEDPELDQGSEATEEDGEGAGLYEHFAVPRREFRAGYLRG